MDVIEAKKSKEQRGNLLDLLLVMSVIILIGLGICLYYGVGMGTQQRDENKDLDITNKTIETIQPDTYRRVMPEEGSKQAQQYNNIIQELKQVRQDLAEINEKIKQEIETGAQYGEHGYLNNIAWILEQIGLRKFDATNPSSSGGASGTQMLLNLECERATLENKQASLLKSLEALVGLEKV